MFKNIIKVLLANIIVMFTSVINTLIIPKLLSIDGYAEYQTFMLYISYVGLTTFGFHSGLFIKYGGTNKNELKKGQFKSEMRLVLYSQTIISIGVLIVALIGKNTLLFYASLCVLSINFVSVYKYLYQAWNQFNKFSILNIVQSLGFSGVVLAIGLFQKDLSASEVIVVYIMSSAICFIGVFGGYTKDVRGVKGDPLISHENKRIFEIGFLLMMGGAVDIVFHSIDKYFIKILFTNYEFSMYCFAITLLNVMNVFISAIAQPMYIQLATNLDDIKGRKSYKEILFCFGALSGCAYYAVAIIVKYFIPEYNSSLKVTAILFVIFPAVAVINCLYVNLYKATNQVKKYVAALGIMSVCSLILNFCGVIIYRNYMSIVLATAICYYIWLVYSSRHFEGLKIERRDVIFLTGFMLLYFLLTWISNPWIGFFVYLVGILCWELVIYQQRLRQVAVIGLRMVRGRNHSE